MLDPFEFEAEDRGGFNAVVSGTYRTLDDWRDGYYITVKFAEDTLNTGLWCVEIIADDVASGKAQAQQHYYDIVEYIRSLINWVINQ